jgi:ATP-dependent Clp protease protease subunit
MHPMIYEKVKGGEAVYDIYSRLAKDRILFLHDEIDAEVATAFTATLFWLDSQNNKEDISIYINSPGGTVNDGLLTIYDTIQFIESPVRTICIGEAYSAAAVILSAGTKGKRFAYQHSKVMIHAVQVWGIQGSQKEIELESNRVKELNEVLMNILARHCGKTLDKIRKDCVTDKYFTAEEALNYGLIDKIIRPKKDIPRLIDKPLKKKKITDKASKIE